MNQVLKNYLGFFGYNDFKSKLQHQAIVKIHEGKDVFINFPRASGKSLCYQLPAFVKRKKCAIIFVSCTSYLNDEIQFLKSRNIKVCAFDHDFMRIKDKKIKLQHEELLKRKDINLLYVSVNLCDKKWFQDYLKEKVRLNFVSFFVVDEANCISKNNLCYNKNYESVVKIRLLYNEVQFVVVTSTITSQVKLDILNKLNMNNSIIIESNDTVVKNTYIDVILRDLIDNPHDHMKQLIKFSLKNENDRAIIFCRTVEQTLLISKELSQQGVPTIIYNSSISKNQQYEHKNLWTSGQVKVIATNHNFIFGLNYQFVRCVIHWTIPQSMTQYYRQISTAARDGNLSVCRAYYSLEDAAELKLYLFNKSQAINDESKILNDYLFGTKCRHVIYSDYFGKKSECCGNLCDNCAHGESVKNMLSQFDKLKSTRLLTNIAQNKIIKAKEIRNNKKTKTRYNYLDTIRELPDKLQPYAQVYKSHESNNDYDHRLCIRTFNFHVLFRKLYKNYTSNADESSIALNLSDILRLGRILEFYLASYSQVGHMYRKNMLNVVSIKIK
ncbi:ATP-dependent DNA helicase Q5-like [Aphidius gifuensis]|uniref:ATP-dependent DNA helicase Q5-like n=1 Tax=Aphidius gifuensis TaxID=684658 RepID=UPI001CDD8BF2|nr:ATP-dependent DNA helicase Q5-like [Aphidius gifuensis]